MSGIQLFLFIGLVFFNLGVVAGAALERRRRKHPPSTPGGAFLLWGTLFPIPPMLVVSVDAAARAGWLPWTPALYEFVRVGRAGAAPYIGLLLLSMLVSAVVDLRREMRSR